MPQTSLRTKMLEAFRMRMYIFMSIAAIMFLILIIQVINLQMIQRRIYVRKAKLNMESKIPIPASRGLIFDRNYYVKDKRIALVSNRPSFNLVTIPANFRPKKKKNREARRKALERLKKVIQDLSQLIKINPAEVIKDIRSRNSYERVIIKEDVDFNTIVKIASHQHRFPHIEWEDAPVRIYTYKNAFAHSIGYIGIIDRKEYKRLKKFGYKHYQKIGKSGIEKQYDTILKGKDGYIRRIVDVRNRTEGEELGKKPVPGNNIVLTLDYNIQKVAHEAMGTMKGAAIAIKPATGEVVALVSKPDFDPNQIISKDNRKILVELYKNANKPFLNRTIQSRYPPASTFKLITAITGLETDNATPNTTFYCPGKYTLRGYKDRDYYCLEAHGALNLIWAIGKSCNVYFYNLGYKVGPTNILKYARYFGLNEKSGIDLMGEIRGFLPSKKWKLKTFGQPWFDGDTLNLSIGQGFVSVTPIEMANFVCGIVNNGIIYRPHIIKEIHLNNNTIQRITKKKIRELPLSPLTLQTVKQGMRTAVTSGTCMFLKSLKSPLCGKTGTAQIRSQRKATKHHGWYLGYGPFGGTPEQSVVVVVFIEEGGYGAASAVPVARKMYEALIKEGYMK